MIISAWQKESYIDYPKKISTVLFIPECNYNCPTCHAKKLFNLKSRINIKQISDYLDNSKGWLDAIVLGGGEPTTQEGLLQFLEQIRTFGLKIKLDTNGSNPKVLEELINSNLLDYIAMDIKAPKELYGLLTNSKDVKTIEESMKIISASSIDYEFRTTIVPLYNTNLRFMNNKELIEIAKWILENANHNSKYYLQKFVARGKEEILDEKFSKERLDENFWETPINLLYKLRDDVRNYLPNCNLRNSLL